MSEQQWQHLSADTLIDHIEEWQLVDIRDPNAFSQGRIPGSVNLNNDNVQSYIEQQDFDKPLVVICYHGNSSKAAAAVLSGAGFKTVYSLDGGMGLWSQLYPEHIQRD